MMTRRQAQSSTRRKPRTKAPSNSLLQIRDSKAKVSRDLPWRRGGKHRNHCLSSRYQPVSCPLPTPPVSDFGLGPSRGGYAYYTSRQAGLHACPQLSFSVTSYQTHVLPVFLIFGPLVPWLLWGREDWFLLLHPVKRWVSRWASSCNDSPRLSPLVSSPRPPETRRGEQCLLLDDRSSRNMRKYFSVPMNKAHVLIHTTRESKGFVFHPQRSAEKNAESRFLSCTFHTRHPIVGEVPEAK